MRVGVLNSKWLRRGSKECDNVKFMQNVLKFLVCSTVCHLFNKNPVSRSQSVGLELLKAGGLNVRIRTDAW
jgi:hypothetical protein